MNMKRASIVLIALTALMLMPVLASAQPTPPPITPADGTANIAVLMAFADGNFEDTVRVNITCSSGTISPTFADLSNGEGQVFVIDDLPAGVDHTCTVTEGEGDAYAATYLCLPGWAGASDNCGNPVNPSNIRCQFDDVNPYVIDSALSDSVGYCFIENRVEAVDVDVTKVWDLTAAGRNDVDTDVRLTLNCDARILGGDRTFNNRWVRTIWLGGSDYEDEDGDDQGFGVAEYEVIPEWYPTANNPDNQRYTRCRVEENASNDDAVLVDNGCLDIQLAAGMGAECTITNTVFYEGIPTLNQYGMAIMALLMLGMGLVGFRRFV